MLKRIPTELLRPGFRLPGALRDRSGRVLVAAGACLTASHLAGLQRQLVIGLYGDSDWLDASAPAASTANASPTPNQSSAPTADVSPTVEKPDEASEPDGRTISVGALRDGMRLSESIYGEDGVLLLAAGTEVTPRFLHLLSNRRITRVHLQPAEVLERRDHFETASTETLDACLANEISRQPAVRSRSGALRPRLPLADLRAEAVRGLERHLAAGTLLAETCDSLRSGGASAGVQVRQVARDFASMLTLDADLLPLIVSMQQTQGEYLFDHCVNVALMSMAVAAQVGFDHDHIMEIGFGALLEDIGMLRVPDEIRLAPRPLTSDEWFEIQRHPCYTIDYLDQIRDVPTAAKFIGYQLHERVDASGYPRQRSALFMHPYARIAAVADAYVAMTRPRPHRPSMMPYLAAKTVLLEGSVDRFDRATVRGFLDSVSLFPVGSLVELDDGTRARVIRATPGVQTRPVVEALAIHDTPTGDTIDLSRETARTVRRALPCEAAPAGAVISCSN